MNTRRNWSHAAIDRNQLAPIVEEPHRRQGSSKKSRFATHYWKCLELGKCLELDRTPRPMPISFGPSGYPCRKYECFCKKTCPVPQSIKGRRTKMAEALSQRSTSETQVLKMLSHGAPMVEVLHSLQAPPFIAGNCMMPSGKVGGCPPFSSGTKARPV